MLILLLSFGQIVYAQHAWSGGFDDISLVVSGKYIDSEAGIEIDLPEGWTGMKLGPLGAIISPYDSLLSNSSNASMMINIANITMLAEGIKTVAIMNVSDSMTNSTDQSGGIKCNDEKSYVNINGMISMHAVSECKNPANGSQFSKSNIYNIATEENLISVSLTSNSADAYEEFEEEFENSIQTLRIRNSIDHRTIWNEALGLKSEIHAVRANGNDVHITLQSNSEISNFIFDEAQKRITFTAEGKNGTTGLTILPIGRVLQGPYTVTIDGEAQNDFTLADDQIAGESLLEIGYRHSSHDILITGTNVVPEFPLPLVGILVIATLGTIAISGRLRGR